MHQTQFEDVFVEILPVTNGKDHHDKLNNLSQQFQKVHEGGKGGLHILGAAC